MQKRVRCALCGMVVWRSQIKRFHDIDVLACDRVSRPGGSGGFRYTESEDIGLVDLVKSKIRLLYQRYFETETIPPLTFYPGVKQRVTAQLVSDSVTLRPKLLVISGVSE